MEQMTLFDNSRVMSPLASRLRPETLDEFVGQVHLLGQGKILRQLIERDQISSMIFWGPTGVGKTTLASIIAGRTRSEFINFSAVTSGIKEIYLSMAPKSNAVYAACEACKKDVVERPSEPVPLQIRNAPTALMKEKRNKL